MFFDPLWFYLKGLAVTLIVEVGLFYLIISKKPLHVTAAVSFNISTHLALHLFFRMMVIWGFGYNTFVWIIGELLVLAIEGFLYYISKLIPKATKAYLWAAIFNISSILIGYTINLIIL